MFVIPIATCVIGAFVGTNYAHTFNLDRTTAGYLVGVTGAIVGLAWAVKTAH